MMEGGAKALEHRFDRDGRVFVLGRDAQCDIRLGGVGVSRRHAVVRADIDHVVLEDLGSACGTLVNNERIEHSILESGDIVTIGVNEFVAHIDKAAVHFQTSRRYQEPESSPVQSPPRSVLRIGRDTDNDIHINHPLVSRYHAELHAGPDGISEIVDLGTTNGTFINGRPVRRGRISAGDVVQIGPFRFSLREGTLVQTDDSNRINVAAENIHVVARGTHLLRGIDLSIAPGELVALLGPSGAGKTTLANALAGRIRIQRGNVRFNGLSLDKFLSAFSSRVGFVSQNNLLHSHLTVRETFVEQSLLRLPSDSVPAERDDRIRTIVELLELTHTLDRRIHRLSGGEQKRVHLGIELLASPPVVFLDEPMAGLDSGLVRTSMELFRKVSDRGHTLLVTTHTLEHIQVCDRVVFLNKGMVAYDGPPGRIGEVLGVETVAEAYEAVRKGVAQRSEKRSDSRDRGERRFGPPVHLTRPKIVGSMRQIGVLVPRYLKLWVREYWNAVLVFLQIPLITMLLALVYRHDASFLPASFYFSVAISAVWCGGTNSVREIAREWRHFEREYRAGMSSTAYGIAKTIVFGTLGAFQGLVFFALLAMTFDVFAGTWSNLMITVAGSFLGALLGLCVSTFSSGVAQAVSWLPLIFIPQVFFSGILVPFDRMPAVGRVISHLTIARPIFSLFKRSAVLEQPVWIWRYWQAPILLAIGSIIFLLSGLVLRRFFQRW